MSRSLRSYLELVKPASLGVARQEPLTARILLRSLCLYYLGRRVVHGRLRANNRRMRKMRKEFYTRAWLRAAEMTRLRLTTERSGVAEIEFRGRKLRVSDNTTSLDSVAILRRSADKAAIRSLLTRAGIPTPRYILVTTDEFSGARRMLESSRVPLVVKPAANTGSGAGVSTNVTTVPQLRVAVAWARAFGPRILIEEQVSGDCYRILIMDGEILDVVIRHPPTLVADGNSTIGQLLRRENELRLNAGIGRAQVLLRLDPDLHNSLASQGLSLHSRPARGHRIVIKGVVNDNAGIDNSSAMGRLCPSITDAVLKAGALLGARLVGVDVICTDPTVPLEQSGGVILEVNTTPGFYYHYYNIDREFSAAEHILRRFFAPVTNASAEPDTMSA